MLVEKKKKQKGQIEIQHLVYYISAIQKKIQPADNLMVLYFSNLCENFEQIIC